MLGAGTGVEPGIIKLHQADGAGQVGSLAGGSLGLPVLAPFRPFKLLLRGWGKIPWRHVGGGKPVLDPFVDRHQRLAGEHAAAKQGQLARPRKHPDPDAAPGIADQFEHIRLLGRLAGILDDDVERPPVRQLALAALAVALQADQVEQPVGLVRIETGPGLAVFRAVERALRQHRVLPLDRQTEIDHLVDLVPVGGERQGPPEADVAHQPAPHRVVDIQIGIQRQLAARPGPPQPHLVVVGRLAGFQKGVVVEAEIACLQIAFAGAGLGRDDLAAGDREHHPVEIRQLMAGAVNPVIIRVPLKD